MSTGHRTDVPRPAGEATSKPVKVNGLTYPTVMDRKETQRFPVNRVVNDLLDAAKGGRSTDMNAIWLAHHNGKYTLDEMREFYRLIGYSLSGYCEIFEDDVVDNPLWEE